jgi:hypothetical protein
MSSRPPTQLALLFTAIGNGKVDEALDLIQRIDAEELLNKDAAGRTALHKAIEFLIPNIIEALITKNRKLLFIEDGRGLNPLACALKQYAQSRSIDSKTIANQIYFKLLRGKERNDTVNQRANIHDTVAVLHDRVWQHGLEMCFKKNTEGKIIDIDKDWLDFVVQVVDDGLTVDYGLLGGASVNRDVMLWWVDSNYELDASIMFDQAVGSQKDDLAGRTITQMKRNTNLTHSKEMQQRAAIKLPFLITSAQDPLTTRPDATKPEALIFYNDSFYYRDGATTTKLELQEFREDQRASLQALMTVFASKNINRIATYEEALNVFNVKPLPVIAAFVPKAVASAQGSSMRSIRSMRPPQAFFTMKEDAVESTTPKVGPQATTGEPDDLVFGAL